MTKQHLLGGAVLSFLIACGSSADPGGGSVPGIVDQGLGTQDLSCVRLDVRPADELSQALATACGCDPNPAHLRGTGKKWKVSDCSSATAACVNGVLDTNGYRDPPWVARVSSICTCAPLVVIYDPCPSCTKGSKADGGASGGGGDDDDFVHCRRHHHEEGEGDD